VLHPDRYRAHDAPITVQFTETDGDILHEDTMGELELQVWRTVLRGGGEVLTDLAIGWGGDRLRVYGPQGDPALVLVTVWDDTTSARRFADGPAGRFAELARPGYRTRVDRIALDRRPAVRVVSAPEGWERWSRLPEARVLEPQEALR